MVTEFLTGLVMIGFTAYYITDVLLYNDAPQPFQRPDKKVVLYGQISEDKTTVEEKSHPVGLFDYVRRFYGLYHVGNKEWTVNSSRLPVWQCPKCLSFWVSLHLLTLLAIITSNILFFAYLFAVPGFVWALSQALDREE